MKKRMLIFIRSFLIVALSTSNIWLISHKLYTEAIIISGFFSFIYTLNIRDLAIANWVDRLFYICGGILGTTVVLYIPLILIKE